MADPEELDEDLFADLYDNDGVAAKPPQPPPATAPEAEPTQPEPSESFEPTAAPQVADSGVVAQEDVRHDDMDMGGGGWNENTPVSHDDNYGPITVKEDG